MGSRLYRRQYRPVGPGAGAGAAGMMPRTRRSVASASCSRALPGQPRGVAHVVCRGMRAQRKTRASAFPIRRRATCSASPGGMRPASGCHADTIRSTDRRLQASSAAQRSAAADPADPFTPTTTGPASTVPRAGGAEPAGSVRCDPRPNPWLLRRGLAPAEPAKSACQAPSWICLLARGSSTRRRPRSSAGRFRSGGPT
jgi:hypothetical protein